MSVPMGRGGQKYCDEATFRIKNLASVFPDKFIEVDGGIDLETILKVWKAGAKAAVIGSSLTQSENPEETLMKLERVLKRARSREQLNNYYRLGVLTVEKSMYP